MEETARSKMAAAVPSNISGELEARKDERHSSVAQTK